jgi:hypothetical protein
MRIQITAKQHTLKKQHCRGPHRRPATKPGQDRLAHHRLHLNSRNALTKMVRPKSITIDTRDKGRESGFMSGFR